MANEPTMPALTGRADITPRAAAASVLDVDAGNTRVKWRAGNGMEGNCPPDALSPLLELAAAARPSRIRVASVSSPAFNSRLAQALASAYGAEPEFAVTTRRVGDVVCGYDDPATMGVDRWLSVLAAWKRAQGPVVIVSAGTAITVDAVLADGRHQGGYIVPGLGLMQRSLGQHTAQVRIDGGIDAPAGLPQLGRSTRDAVQRGLLRMAGAFIDASFADFAGAVGSTPPLYVGGGDAGILAPLLQSPHEVHTALVLDGLPIALP